MEEIIRINDRITLKPNCPEDKENMVRYLNDPVLYRNTASIPSPYTEKDADEFMAKYLKRQEELGMAFNWGIRHREAGLIGGIGAFVKTGVDGHKDEIGYWLAAPFRGQGIMSEIVQKFCDWLFEHRPLARIEAWVFSHNPASAKVLENAGFQREGLARKFHKKDGEYFDAILMAKIRED